MWNEYRATWREFSRKLNELQHLIEAGDEQARLQVEAARKAHNEARDRLAEHLRVSKTARSLWQSAGEPQGTAESDWLRAERLVRTASA